MVNPDMVIAYIDPGFMGYLLQILVAAGATSALSAVVFWRRFKGRVASLFSKNSGESGNNTTVAANNSSTTAANNSSTTAANNSRSKWTTTANRGHAFVSDSLLWG